jgi:hypothetical protein
MINENPHFVNNLLMSDEAHFRLSGFVNKQIFGTGQVKTLKRSIKSRSTERNS